MIRAEQPPSHSDHRISDAVASPPSIRPNARGNTSGIRSRGPARSTRPTHRDAGGGRARAGDSKPHHSFRGLRQPAQLSSSVGRSLSPLRGSSPSRGPADPALRLAHEIGTEDDARPVGSHRARATWFPGFMPRFGVRVDRRRASPPARCRPHRRGVESASRAAVSASLTSSSPAFRLPVRTGPGTDHGVQRPRRPTGVDVRGLSGKIPLEAEYRTTPSMLDYAGH